MRSFAAPRNKIIFTYPSYTLYRVLANLYDLDIQEVPLKEDFTIQEQLSQGDERIIFLANPNSPTGIAASVDIIEDICRSSSGVVVVDEAYADFARETAQYTKEQILSRSSTAMLAQANTVPHIVMRLLR